MDTKDIDLEWLGVTLSWGHDKFLTDGTAGNSVGAVRTQFSQ